ncbi:hypothetical protein PRIPAC_86175 [Pristionchus pacificus]|uniref:DUF7622 domain-containing protein n=1 Tax=Pristionchus pacificus TaxID=54126 RepID=A0A2A6BRX2_PRIPA|nr:hypothetical protein PRIPAC_86175 [Pristionchus pacificus]|eukprot:PDM68679.1 hypothetical protein PRIPAC_46981 [Pristionchus pacificus]
MFHNLIMIDQTSKIDSKGNVVPISSLIANCNSLQCTNRAKELQSKTFISSRTQVSCYSIQTGSKQRANESFQYSCTGDFCYVSSYHRHNQTRGCLTIVDESLAERKVEVANNIFQMPILFTQEGKFVFLLLNVYICSTNYCNLEDMDSGNTAHTVESYHALLEEIKKKAGRNNTSFNLISNFFVGLKSGGDETWCRRVAQEIPNEAGEACSPLMIFERKMPTSKSVLEFDEEHN